MMKTVMKTVEPAEREAKFDSIRPLYLDALTLVERERGRLTGGAEDVETVAAVVDQVAGELGGASGVGRAVLVDGSGDGGDYAAEL